MRERRRYVRSDGLVLVNYRVPQLQLEGKSSAYDVCAGGLRITVSRKLEIGTLVDLEIFLPSSSQPILAKGETVWTEKCKQKKEYFYVGLNFTAIDENSRTRITTYIYAKTHQGE